jgi:hypothetical protein
MCGIVGYVGPKSAEKVLISGLKRLEYRGYDSAGVSVISDQSGLETRKRAGKVSVLVQELLDAPSQLHTSELVTLDGLLTVLQLITTLTPTSVAPTTSFRLSTMGSLKTSPA